LWEKHCFEQLLEWINDDLIKTHWVALFRVEGATWVELKKEEEIEITKTKKEFVEAFPLVSMRRQDVA
jgi:hypothetical protein